MDQIATKRYNILSSTAKLAKDMAMDSWDVSARTTTDLTRTSLGIAVASK